MWVQVGNSDAREARRDGDSPDEEYKFVALKGDRITLVEIPDEADLTLGQKLAVVHESLANHFDGAVRPRWVESSSTTLQAVLAENYGVDAVKPDGAGDHPRVAQLKHEAEGRR